MKNKEIKLLSIKEYAAVLGISTAAVYLRISRETLESSKIFGVTVVDPASDTTPQRGRPKK